MEEEKLLEYIFKEEFCLYTQEYRQSKNEGKEAEAAALRASSSFLLKGK